MKLSIVNFQNNQQDSKLVMTQQTEAQSYKCYGQSISQPNYFYWNQNAQVSNKIKKSHKMSPTTSNNVFQQVSSKDSNNQIVYELSPMTNSLFNVSKRRRKQSLHSHEKVFNVNDNISCSSSSSGSIQSRSASPKLKKQRKMPTVNNSIPRQEFVQCYSNTTQPMCINTQQVCTPMTVNATLPCIPANCQPQFSSFVQQQTQPSTLPRIVRSSISIRELLN